MQYELCSCTLGGSRVPLNSVAAMLRNTLARNDTLMHCNMSGAQLSGLGAGAMMSQHTFLQAHCILVQVIYVPPAPNSNPLHSKKSEVHQSISIEKHSFDLEDHPKGFFSLLHYRNTKTHLRSLLGASVWQTVSKFHWEVAATGSLSLVCPSCLV